MHRLRITGVSAGRPNLWKLLSTPPASAVSETNSRNGNVMRSRSVVRRELLRLVDRARCETARDEPGTEHAERGDDQQHAAERAGRARDELLQFLVAALFLDLGEDRHERDRERALGEQAAQEVRYAERDPERVGRRVRAERVRDRLLADQAEDARDERAAGEGQRGAQQARARAHRHCPTPSVVPAKAATQRLSSTRARKPEALDPLAGTTGGA